ncbi:MAG TPA: glycosyltransferase [Solirubrobacteraceae bacterium]|nr:glycosyltransferase [Solirubrobacteraceae bacterium]
MRVSVVVPCFNYGRYLAEAVRSVLVQSLREVEVIIVDDGSTDDSRAVAQSLIEADPQAGIHLITQANCGSPGQTRNVGIAAARGEYVVCLDADDRLHPEYLARCAAALDAHADAAIAYGDLQMFGDDETLHVPPEWDTRVQLDCNFLDVASMFRRSVWTEVGGYDGEIGYEDWDFWIGVIEQGWTGVKAPGALWYYRKHGSGVFAQHTLRDQKIKAEIVRKHPGLYNDRQREWAAGIVADDPQALDDGTQQGAIPPFREVKRVASAAGGTAGLPVRSVCLITKDYPPAVPGGIPRAVQMQAHRLAAAGVEVHVITKAQAGTPATREDAGVVVHEIPEPGTALPGGLHYLEIPIWSFVAAAKFAELDATVRFDVVEAPDYRGEALHLAPRPETALVVWLHSTMKVVWDVEPGYVPNATDDAWHALEMAALERADLLLAPSQLLLDTTAGFLGDRMRPSELMPLLFDAQQFPVQRRPRTDGRIRVLFFGRLEARKNPELVLHAVAAARAQGLDVEVTMVGRNNANHRERVMAPLEAQLGLTDVTYIPHVDLDGLRTILSQSDVAILPSRFDNSPMTIFEALSSGVPVITSDRVGTSSWIEPGNGLLALAVDDPGRFGAQAAAALADATWMATGERAAATIRERFAPEVVTGRLLDAYGRLMAQRGVAAPVPASATEIEMTPEQSSDAARRLAQVVAEPPAQPIDGARSRAVLAFADELVQEPSLLAAWSDAFDGSDDVTLVIYAPHWSPERAGESLGPAVAQAGLDGDDAADLLALATPATVALEASLARGASAILTGHSPRPPFAALPRVDAASVPLLAQSTRAA